MPIGGISSLKGCLATRFGVPRTRIGDSFPDVLLNNLAIGDETDH
jgi:hypothetical protein